MDTPGSAHASRVSAHTTAGTRLSSLSDRRLAEAVTAAPVLGTGIGGRTAELDVAGVRVFVKRVPLTDVELRPQNLHSTRNVFGLPLFYQYGVGSAGFGAWRELAAHVLTTDWVLSNAYGGFPLLHHWRILPDTPPEGFADYLGGIEGAVAHWEGSPAVRHRLEAIAAASHSLVLFLEHIPHTLASRLGGTRPPGTGSPYLWAERELRRGTEFMSTHGLIHFDAHFLNVLTDGRQVYFADLGLALSRDFDLSPQEQVFLTAHMDYDRSYTPTHLLRRHLPKTVLAGSDLATFLHHWQQRRRPTTVPPDLAALIDRHAPHAIILNDFLDRLLTHSKRTPFPTAEIRRALVPCGPADQP